MSIKKILLLVSMALAAVALAAPSAAQADPRWFDEETEAFVPEGFHANLHAEGELIFRFSNGIVIGPCQATIGGLAINENEMASGAVTNATTQQHCPTPAPSCQATPTLEDESLPWEVTGTTELTGFGEGLEIKGVTFTIDFNQQCQAFGFPPQIAIAGTATAITSVPFWLNFEVHNDKLIVEKTGITVDIEGALIHTSIILL